MAKEEPPKRHKHLTDKEYEEEKEKFERQTIIGDSHKIQGYYKEGKHGGWDHMSKKEMAEVDRKRKGK